MLHEAGVFGFVAEARESHNNYALLWSIATQWAKAPKPEPIPFDEKHAMEALFERRGKRPKRSYRKKVN